VLLLDDLIATGGTATAAAQLLREVGAKVVAACFVVDLPDLGGAKRLRDAGIEVQALLQF
jgi:adenine phosphoribosyltransferase